MIKVKYASLIEAFQDYNGAYETELQALPVEVWTALNDYFDGSNVECTGGLSDLFDDLWINRLYIDDAKSLENGYLMDGSFTILYVDDRTAYLLAS